MLRLAARLLAGLVTTALVLAGMSVLDAADASAASTPAQRAWQWVTRQDGTGTTVVSNSTIRAARAYAADWTGPVNGTFRPRTVTTAVVTDPSGTSVYDGWVVRAYVVTDVAYLISEQAARSDNTFAFPDSRPGTKVFQLVRTADGAVLAEAATDYGLVRSYAGGTRCYAYDQALAVLAGLAAGADVSALAAGLVTLQAPDGGFLDSADVRNPFAGVRIERTGVASVAAYALLRALTALDPTDPLRPTIDAAARSALAWLLAQRRADGLLGAGAGDYAADGSVDPSARPAWASTEHQLDAWQALRLAASVYPDADYGTSAATLADAVVATLWNASSGRFRQGLDPAGAADDTDPLDVSSWGALFLRSSGHAALADQALAHAGAFASKVRTQTGYRAYYPQPAFPSAKANVWTEGTAGVVLARVRAGDASGASAELDSLARMQRNDGGFPYAAAADAATGMTDAASVAAACWFVLASDAVAGGTAIWP